MRTKIFKVLPYLSIFNSIYLSYLYFETFMLGKDSEKLVIEFASPLFTIPFILISSLFIKVITILFSKTKRKFRIFNSGFNILLIFILFGLFSYGLFFYNYRIDNFRHLASVLIEIISISIIVGSEKDKMIYNLLSVFVLWFFTIVTTTLLYNFVVYVGYSSLDFENDKLLYSAIFFHLFNACFLATAVIPRMKHRRL